MTKAEHSSLFWALKVNDENHIGLFGPTLKRRGRLSCPECEKLVERGLLWRADPKTKWGGGDTGAHGYWITDAGREALQRPEETRPAFETVN